MQCPDANPLEGFTFEMCDPLTGDQEDQVVTWQGSSDITGVGEMLAISCGDVFQAKFVRL